MIDLLDCIIAAGDRVDFKKYIAKAPTRELAGIAARAAKVQDFSELAMAELRRRKS